MEAARRDSGGAEGWPEHLHLVLLMRANDLTRRAPRHAPLGTILSISRRFSGGASAPASPERPGSIAPQTSGRSPLHGDGPVLMSAPRIRIIRHEAVPDTGSYEVRFADGRVSRFFYYDNVLARRLRPGILTIEQAFEQAKALARAERKT